MTSGPSSNPHSSPGRSVAVSEILKPPGWEALVAGHHGDPFALLGPHMVPGSDQRVLRALLPGAKAVWMVLPGRPDAIQLDEVAEPGLFGAFMPSDVDTLEYRLRVLWPDGTEQVLTDPYCLSPKLGELDVHLLAEGEHRRAWEVLGAHPGLHDGHEGTAFAVWAPNAQRVSVVGEFNGWDGRRHPMRLRRECGVWEIFLPDVRAGAVYKYEILTAAGERLLKADPYARHAELPPATASLVWADGNFGWSDQAWMNEREQTQSRARAISIYELHAGSWQRHPDGAWLSYRELAERLVPYVAELGFTHIELLPISEHPFSGSWGYQPSGLFAPTARFGSPDDFRYLVDCCHEAGLGVILDWVPGHFPDDAHGLARFDGSCLYEHEDERQGRHRDWGTLIYNYGRREVRNFLIGNALFWLEEFHLDGLRIDAVASMLYLDYSREPGDWLPNQDGDNRNLEAVEFLRRLNLAVHAEHPGVLMIAEESTAWPAVSRPPEHGGLGFGYKWNMGWMNDTLHYFGLDPVYRRHHHQDLTFGPMYAFSENFVLPISHDEVVHGKGSLLSRMPGDRWRQLAQTRLALAWQFAYPGKKLLFMGCEFAQEHEWNHDAELDWAVLDNPAHAGIQRLVADLNRLYKNCPALHELDCEEGGFHWLSCNDADQNVVVFARRGHGPGFVVIACNFSPVVRHDYRVGVPLEGTYRELLNSDALEYGGSGVGNLGGVSSDGQAWHGHGQSLSLSLPPLGALVLASPDLPLLVRCD